MERLVYAGLAYLALGLWIAWLVWDANRTMREWYGDDWLEIDWEAVAEQRKKTREALRFQHPTQIEGKLDP